jgi:TRAP-type transport system periplasmic protein
MNRTIRWSVFLACLFAFAGVATQAGAETKTLRVATLAPKNSSWGKELKKWRKFLKKKTDGKLDVKIYYNAVQGDEKAMVSKMRGRQLDGAILSSGGLSSIYKGVLVLQLPGVVDTWSVLDRVRKGMKADIAKGFEKEGFEVTSWGDIGRVYQMSKGFAVRSPEDLRGKSPLVWRDEAVGPIVFSSIGGITPVPLGPMEVLPALRSGKINVLSAPSLAAEQLQWAPHIDHIGSQGTVCAVGGTVFRKEVLDGLDADVKSAFLKVQRKLGKRGIKRIRKLDDQAYDRLASKMTVVTLTAAETSQWEGLLKKAIRRLAQGTYDKAMIKKVVKLAGKKGNWLN